MPHSPSIAMLSGGAVRGVPRAPGFHASAGDSAARHANDPGRTLCDMALPTGMTLRQETAADIPALVALGDATWFARYGRTGYITAELLEMGLTRPSGIPSGTTR